MVDYLTVYDEQIGRAPTTAAAKRKRKRRASRLTAKKSRSQLAQARHSETSTQRRTPLRSPREENVVKKRRTAAQKAATRKMIAANRRSARESRRSKRGRRNPLVIKGKNVKARKIRVGKKKRLLVTGSKLKVKRVAKRRGRTLTHRVRSYHAKKAKTKSRKRSLAAKKAARTRKANKLARSAAARKGRKSSKQAKSRKGGGRKSTKRSLAGKKAARTRKRNLAKRRKAASGYTGPERQLAAESRRRRKKSRRRRKNPIARAANPVRRRRRRRSNPIRIKNPIPLEGGLDFFSGLFAVTIGYLVASGADRMGATHALTPSTTQGGFIDAPAVGQIYDSESPQTPIWSSGMRIAFNALAFAAPLGVSAFVKSKGPKSFFQLMSFGALARVLGKTADDGMSYALNTTAFGMRLYAPEMAAQAKLTSAATTALPQGAPGTFLGIPRRPALGAAPPYGFAGPSPKAAPIVQHRPPAPPNAQQPFNQPPQPQRTVTPLQQHPQSGFQAQPQQGVAGAPQQPSINSEPYTRPLFNPWASTDD